VSGCNEKGDEARCDGTTSEDEVAGNGVDPLTSRFSDESMWFTDDLFE
jgi:hypothetical protein